MVKFIRYSGKRIIEIKKSSVVIRGYRQGEGQNAKEK